MDFSSIQMNGINLLMQTKFEYLNNSYNLLLNLTQPLLDGDKKNFSASFIKIIISQIDVFIKVVLINDPKELFPLINDNSQELVKSFTDLYDSIKSNNSTKNQISEENTIIVNDFQKNFVSEENINKTNNFQKIYAFEENSNKTSEKKLKTNLDDKSEFESSKDDSFSSSNSDTKIKCTKESNAVNGCIKPASFKKLNEENTKKTASLRSKKIKFDDKTTDYEFNYNNNQIKTESMSTKNLNKKCMKIYKTKIISNNSINDIAFKSSKKSLGIIKPKDPLKNNCKIVNKKSGNLKQNKNPKIMTNKTEKRTNHYDKLKPTIINKANFTKYSSVKKSKKYLSRNKSLTKYRINNNTSTIKKISPLKKKSNNFKDKSNKINIKNQLFAQPTSKNIEQKKQKNKYIRSKTTNSYREINDSNSRNFRTRYGRELARTCHQIIDKYKIMEKEVQKKKAVSTGAVKRKQRVSLPNMEGILNLKSKILPTLTTKKSVEKDKNEMRNKFKSDLVLFNNIKTVINDGEKE